jgi:hypothetical protein
MLLEIGGEAELQQGCNRAAIELQQRHMHLELGGEADSTRFRKGDRYAGGGDASLLQLCCKHRAATETLQQSCNRAATEASPP